MLIAFGNAWKDLNKLTTLKERKKNLEREIKLAREAEKKLPPPPPMIESDSDLFSGVSVLHLHPSKPSEEPKTVRDAPKQVSES